jgi:hypothetical protein
MSALHRAANAPLLYIVGADEPEAISRQGRKVGFGGSTDLHKLLGKGETLHRLHVTPNFFRQQRRPELLHYSCIINLITEAEINSRVLDNLRKLLRDHPGKVVNRPEAVLRSTRDQVARRLAGIPGFVAPQVVRLKASKPAIAAQAIKQADLQFPVIVRQAGTHSGKIVGCFDSVDDIQAALSGSEPHIATEFVDFRSPDGLYRKYRMFFIGRHIIFRHMLVSDEWNIHARDRKRFMAGRTELLDEEKRLFVNPAGAFPPEVSQVLKEVRERMALDFFGMDFGIAADGRVVLFEANATMNFFPFMGDPQFAYVQQCYAPAQQAFREMVGLAPAPSTDSPSETDLKPA